MNLWRLAAALLAFIIGANATIVVRGWVAILCGLSAFVFAWWMWGAVERDLPEVAP